MTIPASRRRFLVGCSSALAAMAGSRLGHLGFAPAQEASSNRETLVIVFLRGGMDGLSLIPPIDGADRGFYEDARPILRIPLKGTGAALPLNAQFGMHPSAGVLLPLFQAGKLAIVQAVGTSGSRSHFDAQKYVELGTPGVKTTPEGWLTRYLETSPGLPDTILFPALAAGATPPTALQGSNEFVNLPGSNTFQLGYIGHPSWAGGDEWASLRRLYQLGDTSVHAGGIQALNAAGVIESYVRSDYQPKSGVTYPATPFGDQLKLIAQLIKNDVGLRVATIDLVGWDTHENQGVIPAGRYSLLVKQLCDGLAALYSDLDLSGSDAPVKRLTLVTLSEFGRRIRENANGGTDHGTANPVLVLGGNVLGGLHGQWPGLSPDQRFDNADLAPTTDLRRVLSEILIRRAANPRIGEVFPKYQDYGPLNIVAGPDLVPDYSASIPATPTDFRAERLSAPLIRLTWSPAPHATNYRIERRDAPAGSWEHLIAVGVETLHHDDTTVPDGVNPAYRLQAYNSHGAGEFIVATIAANADPRAQWRLIHFGTSANAGAASDDAVAASDGLSNLVKYALGLDPHVPIHGSTSGFIPGLPRIDLSSNSVSLVYVRPMDRADVRYDVLTSSDLKVWKPVDDVSEGTADGLERRRATVQPTDPKSQFLKLTVRPA